MPSTNVIPLPTAAKRKVKQPHFQTRAFYRAKAELPEHPAEFKTDPQRRAEKQAALLLEMGHSAELLIASAIYQTLDEMQQMKVQMFCAMAAETDEGQQATAWLDYIGGNYGTKSMIKSSLLRLAERGL